MPKSKVIFKFCFCINFLLSTSLSAQNLEKKANKLNDSTIIQLSSVEVKGERPLVKAIDGKLQYDIPQLIKNKAVDNAFEILAQVPGVMVIGDNVSIIGTQGTSILINNRPSPLTLDQLIRMLKSTSPSKVRKVEIMYSTHPQYGVKGASINVILENDKSLKNLVTGEVALNAMQAYYFSPSSWLDLSYASDRISTNFSYSNSTTNSRKEEDMDASQVINNQTYLINQRNRGKISSLSNDVRGIVEYETANKRHLAFSYSGSFGKSIITKTPTTYFVNHDTISTNNRVSKPSSLHSVRFDYTGIKGLTFGGDYVFYSETSQQTLVNLSTHQTEDSIWSNSSQISQKVDVYANMTHKLSSNWKLDYGISGSLSQTKSQSFTTDNKLTNLTTSFVQTQHEQTAGGFIGLSRQVGQKLSLEGSLSLEYSKATIDSSTLHKVLWERLDLFPSMNIKYTPNDNNIFQLSFWSGKSYPSFYETSPSVTYINAYAVVEGNPLLKPSRTYSANLSYVLRSKYVFSAFANHQPGSIEQMPYQSKDSLRMIYTSINMDTRDSYGLSVVFPFKVGTAVDSRITPTAQFVHHKGTLVDIDFDNNKINCSISTNNTIYLTKKHNFFFTADGMFFITPAIQGIYTIDPLWFIDCAFVWKFAGDKAKLSLRGNDIFNSAGAYGHINLVGQHSNIFAFRDLQAISLSFKYSFGDFKKKDIENVDTSRFGNKGVNK